MKKKKLIAIIGVLIVVVVAVVIVIVVNSGSTRYARKMKNYLEKIGYDCDGILQSWDGSLDTERKFFYCQMTNHDGIFKEVLIKRKADASDDISYTQTVNDSYWFTISGDNYYEECPGSFEQIHFFNTDEEDDRVITFRSSGEDFDIGEQLYCDEEKNSYDKTCEKAARAVNSGMREFESFFVGAGLKLEE